uniref:Uncharacterized protein n=1 Tax=Pithovirus LCPAC401 TaxID=2506595 RepID=A0A481ZAH4_9VIRU|nr:MAG: uncharacterized protein LCPAC401_01130 [Pithovirus LCPAC401]
MFLEVSVTIFDSKNRYLDLSKLCEKFPGCGSFGDWKVKGDQLECSGSWTACFAGYYNNLCSKHELSYRTRTGEIKQFNSSDILITDPFSAIFYMMMMLKDIPEAVTYMNGKIKDDSNEPVSVLFPYVDSDTAAILTELEPFIKQISNPSYLNNLFDEWFASIDPKVKTIMIELLRMQKESTTSTREELSNTPSQVESSSVEFRQLLDQFYTRQTDKTEPYSHPIEEVFGKLTYSNEETLPTMIQQLCNPFSPAIDEMDSSQLPIEKENFNNIMSNLDSESFTQQTDILGKIIDAWKDGK